MSISKPNGVAQRQAGWATPINYENISDNE